MCGILGYIGRSLPLPDELARATNLLAHRGPDGGACWHEPGVFLGHRRLSIIDLNTGDQPMFSEDGRFVITFNGEIYNYPELKAELAAAGARFRTTSDTEVILAAYESWGTGAAARLEGMFAFAIFDRRERTTYLARDRFGEKPLLLAEPPGALAFASELGPLAALGLAGSELDPEALGNYLCLNYVPGCRTMLQGVRRLAPAEWRLYGPSGTGDGRRYWSLPAAPRTDRPGAPHLLEELQHALDRAVKLTLRSDVPVGLFLSGGVDSALVAHSAARLGRLERAFCVDVVGAAGFSEFDAASRVARRIDVPLERVPLDASVLSEFMAVTQHLDDPLADSSAMAVWSVARAAGQDVKVVLSGDGGDELFGGYLTYAASRLHQRLRPALPTALWRLLAAASSHVGGHDRAKVSRGYKLHRFLRAMPLPTQQAHFTWNGTWLPQQAARLAAEGAPRDAARQALRGLMEPGTPAPLTMHDLQLADVRQYLANDILAKVDRATMAHGLESRAPLLNSDVATFALSLPLDLRARGTVTKVLLRELCARHYGHDHAYAPKHGFSIPVHTWLRHEGRPLLLGLLERGRVEALGWIDVETVTHTVRQHLAGSTFGWELWGLMVLVSWHEQRVASRPAFHHLPPVRTLPTPLQSPV